MIVVLHFVTADEKSIYFVTEGFLKWSEDLSKGFDECWRVLKPGGTLIFKWNETQISLRDVLSCFSRRPVFGHTTTKRRDTHWMTFYKDAVLKSVEEGR